MTIGDPLFMLNIKSKSQGTDLTGIDFSAPRDFVVIKMDIEVAEYEVIPHMAEMSTGLWLTICWWNGMDKHLGLTNQ
ncbi:hypothetical protein BGZ65_002126 [Modicella reniformis]|uniref:Methyltransferase FkbM domain-containing protein n=1 Tax=Modicella reniformis TaxID=1440133 RepID=A0A9P6M9P8_9FUNG|nr:hypothetical protein BGZ65_002126 [Modicella reniformis]